MTDQAKNKLLNWSIFGFIALLVLGLGAAIGVHIGVYHKHSKTPVAWCLWEIQTHEDYDCDLTYYVQELEPKSEIKKEADKGCNLYCYYIITFTDDRKGEWYCFIECRHKNLFDKTFDYRAYRPDEVVLIDCDLAFETLYEGEGE